MFPDGRRRGNMRPVTDLPPPQPPPPVPPPQTPYAPPAPSFPAPSSPAPPAASPADRVRVAWHRRNDSDYIFDFWTAFGWTVLTFGIYGFYVIYQMVRRSRDHNARRIELLDAATTLAWEQALAKGLGDELRPAFERIAPHMAVLRNQTMQFRDPVVWMIISLLTGGIGHLIIYILLDGDLITHDHAEGAIESELSTIYTRLGAPVASPNPARLKAPHNYVGRIIATILTCGIYGLWWQYDLMTEGNRHFQENWAWEDGLAASVQQLIAA
jgi:hypothetical protein